MWESRKDWVERRSSKWAMLTKLLLAILNNNEPENEEEGNMEGPELYPITDEEGVKFPKMNGCDDPEEGLAQKLSDWDAKKGNAVRDGIEIQEWPLSDGGKKKIIIYVEFVKTLAHLIKVCLLSCGITILTIYFRVWNLVVSSALQQQADECSAMAALSVETKLFLLSRITQKTTGCLSCHPSGMQG